MFGKRLRWGVGVACLALATAACSRGGSGKSNSSAAPSGPSADQTSTGPTLTGDPVVIGSMYPVSASLATFPELEYLAKIAVKVVNASGGIKGRPLEWVHCDDKGDPNVAATCADRLINQDK